LANQSVTSAGWTCRFAIRASSAPDHVKAVALTKDQRGARRPDRQGELVAARVTYSGTHQGEFVSIPATGKQTTTSGVDFFRMQGGRQAEHWGGPDMLSFLQQLGVMPGPGAPV
jgi:hypothetical protein